jgi:C4-dicarboxylate-specific signal transduction histidine kinase
LQRRSVFLAGYFSINRHSAPTEIQDRKLAEESQAELAHINRANSMGEMIASISHELEQAITATASVSIWRWPKDPVLPGSPL